MHHLHHADTFIAYAHAFQLYNDSRTTKVPSHMPVLNTKHKHNRKPSRNSLNPVNCFTHSHKRILNYLTEKDVLYDFGGLF